jgi:hypothetical protein
MAAVAVLALVLLSGPLSALACSVPYGGCVPSKCSALAGLQGKVTANNWATFVPLGTYYDTWNSAKYPNQTASRSQVGGPWVGYEVFPTVEKGYLIKTTPDTTLTGCCKTCGTTPGCTLYQFFEAASYSSIKTGLGALAKTPPGGAYVNGLQCYLLSGGSVAGSWPTKGPDNDGPYGSPYSPKHSAQIVAPYSSIPPSFVGGSCNPAPNVLDDPHFVGAHGTNFDFNGRIGKSFVLISDEGLNVNIKLGGYETEETVGATVQKDGKALRTWIEEIGLTWAGADNKRHSAVLVARKGASQEAGAGFLAGVTVDAESLPVPAADASLSQAGLSLTNVGVTKRGPYDMQVFVLKVADKLDARLHMRAAHKKLQTPTEAHVHFNIHIMNLKTTDKVHGILGQTYRTTSQQVIKALKFTALAHLLGNPVKADGKSGEGFLDGAVADY